MLFLREKPHVSSPATERSVKMDVMELLDLTLPTAAENLALDEALLDEADGSTQARHTLGETEGHTPTRETLGETGGYAPARETLGETEGYAPARETLRLWELDDPVVVVGRSSRIADEVRVDVCRGKGIPILRRSSGGSAVVMGPGCLLYALILNLEKRPGLRAIDRAHRFVLKTLADALRPMVPAVRCRGISDLAIGEEKFSGNSVRVKRRHLLYHGTLLYGFPLELIEECLGMPPRCPPYRKDRSHCTFVTNLPLSAAAIRRALIAAWEAVDVRLDWPQAATERLVAERYGDPQWNLPF
jgi:lipoate-protein ligase A